MSAAPANDVIARLLAEAGLRGEFTCVRLDRGGNNRVFRVRCGERFVLLKEYFRHPQDTRDRLGAEYAFCRFAWEQSLRCIPQPLAYDTGSGLGLYEFIEGRRLIPGEIDKPEIEQALNFFGELNHYRHAPAARTLGPGSEACFTLDEHLACVERRIAALAQIDSTLPGHSEAAALVQHQLRPRWQQLRSWFTSQAAARKLSLDQPLADADRCLSPSDFGFHNALLEPNGRLRFLDFEYSGWDDPAKMACDFFCQPAVPVAIDHFAWFVGRVVAGHPDPDQHARRMELLLPVYRLKWCCIMLNEFLPVGRQRREFARDTAGEEERKALQLQKARNALVELDNFGVA